MILEARTCKSTLSAHLNAILGTPTYRFALSAQRESFSLLGLLAPAAHADVDVRAPGIALRAAVASPPCESLPRTC